MRAKNSTKSALNIASSEFVIQISVFFFISFFFFLPTIQCSWLSSSVTSKTFVVFISFFFLNALLCDYWLAWSMIGKSHSKNFSMFDVQNATAFIGFLPYDNRDALFSDQPQSIDVYAFFYNLSLLQYRMVPQ